jgi:uncharacterized protein (DUF2062 family)
MVKRVLKRYLPNHQTIREHKYLQIFGERLHNPNLWYFNRRSVAGAMGLGIFIALIPLPIHVPLAAVLAIWLRLNLPVILVTIFITNPVTVPAIFYFTYKVGTWMLNTPPHEFTIEFSLHWLLHETGAIWEPLLVGSLSMGVLLGMIVHAAVNRIWRYHVTHKRRKLVKARFDSRL